LPTTPVLDLPEVGVAELAEESLDFVIVALLELLEIGHVVLLETLQLALVLNTKPLFHVRFNPGSPFFIVLFLFFEFVFHFFVIVDFIVGVADFVIANVALVDGVRRGADAVAVASGR
jgi:hypothetical protein